METKKTWSTPTCIVISYGSIEGGSNHAVLESTGHAASHTPADHARAPSGVSWSTAGGHVAVSNWTAAAS